MRTILATAVLIVLTVSGVIFYLSSGQSPNIVLIVMDTVRQDHLSSYGYKRETSPRLSELAEQSRTFYNAYSTSSWTSSAHASLFSGLYPITHGTTQENWVLPDSVVTLAEVLSEAGYQTFGVVENPILGKHAGFDQGFKRYIEAYRDIETDDDENQALLRLKKCLQERRKDTPFLLFVNFIAPHNPYDSSCQFRNRFVTDSAIGGSGNRWKDYYLGRKFFSPPEIENLRQRYDAEILYVDFLIGRIVDELKENRLWSNTIFIVTSDHGENLDDHNHMDHVFSLYETTIKVPLIIHYPKLFPSNSKDHDATQLTDIFPTVLRIAGIDPQQHPSQGYDLLVEGAREGRVVFTEYYRPIQAIRSFNESDRNSPHLQKYQRRIRSVTLDGKKLIWVSEGKNELYDLRADPDERMNLIDTETRTGKDLLDRLDTIVRKYSSNKKIESKSTDDGIDAETENRLRALGYLPAQ